MGMGSARAAGICITGAVGKVDMRQVVWVSIRNIDVNVTSNMNLHSRGRFLTQLSLLCKPAKDPVRHGEHLHDQRFGPGI